MTEVYVLLVEDRSGQTDVVGDDIWTDVVAGVYASPASAKLAGESLKDNARWSKGALWRIEKWNLTP